MADLNKPQQDPVLSEPQGMSGESWPMEPKVEQEFTSEEAVNFDKRDVATFDQNDAEGSRAEEEVVPDVPSDSDYH